MMMMRRVHIWIALSILLILLLLRALYLFMHQMNREGFEDAGNPGCVGKSFCAYDVKEEKCRCAGQKDDARVQFENNPECCERTCNLLPKEKCLATQEKGPVPIKYYCNVAGKCKEYDATVQDSVIMANICGLDGTTGQYIMPFASKEECEKKSDVCDIHNDSKLTPTEQKKGCLADTSCGWCANQSGVGKCVMGSPAGPADLDKYYFCNPSQANPDGSEKGIYEYSGIFKGL
jgi:hypothetical protein